MIQSEKMNEPYNLSLCIYRCHFDSFDAIVLLYICVCVSSVFKNDEHLFNVINYILEGHIPVHAMACRVGGSQ